MRSKAIERCEKNRREEANDRGGSRIIIGNMANVATPMLDQADHLRRGEGKEKNATDKRANVVMSVNGTKHRPRVAVRVGQVTRLCSKDGTVW